MVLRLPDADSTPSLAGMQQFCITFASPLMMLFRSALQKKMRPQIIQLPDWPQSKIIQCSRQLISAGLVSSASRARFL